MADCSEKSCTGWTGVYVWLVGVFSGILAAIYLIRCIAGDTSVGGVTVAVTIVVILSGIIIEVWSITHKKKCPTPLLMAMIMTMCLAAVCFAQFSAMPADLGIVISRDHPDQVEDVDGFTFYNPLIHWVEEYNTAGKVVFKCDDSSFRVRYWYSGPAKTFHVLYGDEGSFEKEVEKAVRTAANLAGKAIISYKLMCFLDDELPDYLPENVSWEISALAGP